MNRSKKYEYHRKTGVGNRADPTAWTKHTWENENGTGVEILAIWEPEAKFYWRHRIVFVIAVYENRLLQPLVEKLYWWLEDRYNNQPRNEYDDAIRGWY